MTISYTVEPADMRAFQIFGEKHLPMARRIRWIKWLCAAALGLQGAVGQNPGTPMLGRVLVFFLFCGLAWCFLTLLHFVVVRLLQWRAYTSDKFKSVLCAHTITLSDDWVTETTAFNETKHRWAGIYRVADGPNHLYILTSANGGYVIPKRAFANPESLRQFFDYAVRMQAGKSAPPVPPPLDSGIVTS